MKSFESNPLLLPLPASLSPCCCCCFFFSAGGPLLQLAAQVAGAAAKRSVCFYCPTQSHGIRRAGGVTGAGGWRRERNRFSHSAIRADEIWPKKIAEWPHYLVGGAVTLSGGQIKRTETVACEDVRLIRHIFLAILHFGQIQRIICIKIIGT